MLHGKSDQRPVRQIVLVLLMGIVAGIALGFGLSVSGGRAPGMASCDIPFGRFRVEPHDGRIVVVDTRTGEILGTPERQPGGEVWLATRDGRIRDMMACLGEKKEWFALAPSERYGR